jgi:hypothetical protein
MDRTCRSSWTVAREYFQAEEYDAGALPMTSEPAWKTTIAGQDQPKIFEFSNKRMRQCINAPFMKECLCVLYHTSSHTLLSGIDRRHLI